MVQSYLVDVSKDTVYLIHSYGRANFIPFDLVAANIKLRSVAERSSYTHVAHCPAHYPEVMLKGLGLDT